MVNSSFHATGEDKVGKGMVDYASSAIECPGIDGGAGGLLDAVGDGDRH
jgi:hypothetical protein